MNFCFRLRAVGKTQRAIRSKGKKILFTAFSRNVVGKSARDNPKRYCGWLWGHCSSKKFERMVWEATDICLRVLKRKATKAGSIASVVTNSVLIISHTTFRDCRVHISSDNLSQNSCIPTEYSYFTLPEKGFFQAWGIWKGREIMSFQSLKGSKRAKLHYFMEVKRQESFLVL